MKQKKEIEAKIEYDKSCGNWEEVIALEWLFSKTTGKTYVQKMQEQPDKRGTKLAEKYDKEDDRAPYEIEQDMIGDWDD